MPEFDEVLTREVAAREIIEARRVETLSLYGGTVGDEGDPCRGKQVEIWVDLPAIEDDEAIDATIPHEPIDPMLARRVARGYEQIVSTLLQDIADLGCEFADDGVRDMPPRRADDERDDLRPLSAEIPRARMHPVIELARSAVHTLVQFWADEGTVIQRAGDRGGRDVRSSRDIRDDWLSVLQ